MTEAANALQELGVRKGDRVAIYMPMIPELPIAMLACARLGAAHTVVFGGFSAEALGDRINDAQAKVLITADGGWRRGKKVGLKQHVDEAVASTPSIEHVLVVNRLGDGCHMVEGRDHWWGEHRRPPERSAATRSRSSRSSCSTCSTPRARRPSRRGSSTPPPATCSRRATPTRSSSTSSPTTCTGAPPTSAGSPATATSSTARSPTPRPAVMYEGAPDTPDWDRWWQIVEDYKVTILYCAPTAIRAFMKQGEAYPAKHDLSSLRVLGSVGEPINPEAWLWYHEHIGRGQAPDRRHVVADRDRRDPDHPAARGDDDQARLGDVPVPGIAADVVDGEGRVRAARRGRLPRPQAALAGDAARHLRRPGALPADLLEPLPGDVLRRRRGEARRGRLPTGCSAGSTT